MGKSLAFIVLSVGLPLPSGSPCGLSILPWWPPAAPSLVWYSADPCIAQPICSHLDSPLPPLCAQRRPAEGCTGRRRSQAPGRISLQARGALATRSIVSNAPGSLCQHLGVTSGSRISGTLCSAEFSPRLSAARFFLAIALQASRQRSPVPAGGRSAGAEQPVHGSERRAEAAG